ncbi:MAG: methyltransferase domain-containing protein [candidate division Zixibacteria bacterium]|nr:methyltransferase domain-containing protein [candidate division Zixibacteria bacterium]
MSKLGPDERPGYKKIDIIEGYDKWASTYDEDPNPLVALEEPVTLEFIGDVRGQRVLDLGCGTGRYCVLLARRGAGVVGIDPSSEMLEQAKRKITPACRFELHKGTIDEMDFPDEHFDLIVSGLTFEHLAELESTFGEAVRVLKTGGRMAVSGVHPYWPVSGHDYTEFFDKAGQEYRIPAYPHLIEEYWRLCRNFGLRVEDIREMKIDDWLIERFPSLKEYRGLPLAVALKLRKSARRSGIEQP